MMHVNALFIAAALSSLALLTQSEFTTTVTQPFPGFLAYECRTRTTTVTATVTEDCPAHAANRVPANVTRALMDIVFHTTLSSSLSAPPLAHESASRSSHSVVAAHSPSLYVSPHTVTTHRGNALVEVPLATPTRKEFESEETTTKWTVTTSTTTTWIWRTMRTRLTASTKLSVETSTSNHSSWTEWTTRIPVSKPTSRVSESTSPTRSVASTMPIIFTNPLREPLPSCFGECEQTSTVFDSATTMTVHAWSTAMTLPTGGLSEATIPSHSTQPRPDGPQVVVPEAPTTTELASDTSAGHVVDEASAKTKTLSKTAINPSGTATAQTSSSLTSSLTLPTVWAHVSVPGTIETGQLPASSGQRLPPSTFPWGFAPTSAVEFLGKSSPTAATVPRPQSISGTVSAGKVFVTSPVLKTTSTSTASTAAPVAHKSSLSDHPPASSAEGTRSGLEVSATATSSPRTPTKRPSTMTTAHRPALSSHQTSSVAQQSATSASSSFPGGISDHSRQQAEEKCSFYCTYEGQTNRHCLHDCTTWWMQQ